jgi:hypothetical protein
MSSNHCVLLLLLPLLLLLLLLLQAEISCMVLQFVSEDITQFEDRGGEVSVFLGGGEGCYCFDGARGVTGS